MQNSAARVILRSLRSANITTHLTSLHWLPDKVRSPYNVTCLRYQCHSSTAPSNLKDMLLKRPSHFGNTRHISHTMPLLNRHVHSEASLGGDWSFTGGYSDSHTVINMFWDITSQFPEEKKRLLLRFVTACSRPPLLGFKVTGCVILHLIGTVCNIVIIRSVIDVTLWWTW